MRDTLTFAHLASVTRLGHALADETRTRILLNLRTEPAAPSDLADRLGVSRQSISNHLACLRGCGLVAADRDGRTALYRLIDPSVATALGGLVRLSLTVDPYCCTGEGCNCR